MSDICLWKCEAVGAASCLPYWSRAEHSEERTYLKVQNKQEPRTQQSYGNIFRENPPQRGHNWHFQKVKLKLDEEERWRKLHYTLFMVYTWLYTTTPISKSNSTLSTVFSFSKTIRIYRWLPLTKGSAMLSLWHHLVDECFTFSAFSKILLLP